MNYPIESLREITKAAIENNVITFQHYSGLDQPEIEKQNEFNAKQVAIFMKEIAQTFNDLK